MTNASFKTLKEKVGVDDIAYSLGYRLKREAGVGKYIEMALPDGRGGNTDTLVISNPKSKVSQLYFHRSGAKGGDVVDLIMENINSFSESGKDKWEKAQKVMAKFANEPIPDYGDSKYLEKAGYKDNQPFDPNRWEVTPATEHMHHVMSYFEPRGIRQETATSSLAASVRKRWRCSLRSLSVSKTFRPRTTTTSILVFLTRCLDQMKWLVMRFEAIRAIRARPPEQILPLPHGSWICQMVIPIA